MTKLTSQNKIILGRQKEALAHISQKYPVVLAAYDKRVIGKYDVATELSFLLYRAKEFAVTERSILELLTEYQRPDRVAPIVMHAPEQFVGNRSMRLYAARRLFLDNSEAYALFQWSHYANQMILAYALLEEIITCATKKK